jgi:hypothetical protein
VVVAVVATAAAVARRQPHLVCGLERGREVVAVGEHARVWGEGTSGGWCGGGVVGEPARVCDDASGGESLASMDERYKKKNIPNTDSGENTLAFE